MVECIIWNKRRKLTKITPSCSTDLSPPFIPFVLVKLLQKELSPPPHYSPSDGSKSFPDDTIKSIPFNGPIDASILFEFNGSHLWLPLMDPSILLSTCIIDRDWIKQEVGPKEKKSSGPVSMRIMMKKEDLPSYLSSTLLQIVFVLTYLLHLSH